VFVNSRFSEISARLRHFIGRAIRNRSAAEIAAGKSPLLGRGAKANRLLLSCPLSQRYSGPGGLLLADALKRIPASAREVASALVVVEARGPSAVAFYQKYGFIPFKDRPRKLFLPMRTIAAADK
jgi:hypothetical protein